jgi:oxygen-dependent protoporphyrinogen oxidase
MAEERVAVVGAGIAGLSAAWFLRQRMPQASIVVLDSGDRPGGKLRAAEVGGVAVDVGAESMLARRPEALDLVGSLGLGAAVVHPDTTAAALWSRGALHPLPRGTVMGVPSAADSAAGVLSADELRRLQAEPARSSPLTESDVAVGEFVAARVGDAVVDRLVEPLLGGVYAGHARTLSLRATVPVLWQAAVTGSSLTATVAAAAAAVAGRDVPPVFAGLEGGVTSLVDALARELRARGVEVRTRATVRELDRIDHGWRLIAGPVPAPEAFDVDAVLLATPATPSSRLLAPHTATAAADLAALDYASLAIVTVALPRGRMPALSGSGLLVPPIEGKVIKAATFTSQKWGWVSAAAPGLILLRASIGRHGQAQDLQRDDDELVSIALRELSEAVGAALPEPVDRHVQRWGGSLPQYAVGHLDRVRRIRESVATLPGLAVAGAAYDGVGIPACIASGRLAAEQLATHLAQRAAATATIEP